MTRDQLFFRSMSLDGIRAVDSRRIDVAFSSETPVRRAFGLEVLLHSPGSVDLTRLQTMGSVLLNHNPDRIIGRVEDARIEGGVGRASILFDNDEAGNRALAKVQSGSLRGVSVGYSIEKIRKVEDKEEWNGIKGPAYVATRWAPYEISLTPIPADASVGVGRDLSRSLDGIEIERGAYMISSTEYNELLSRANQVGPDAVVEFASMVQEGCDAGSILGRLLDLAICRRNGHTHAQSLKTMSDDAFIRSITAPISGPAELGTPPSSQTTIRSLKDVSDDDFIRGLTGASEAIH